MAGSLRDDRVARHLRFRIGRLRRRVDRRVRRVERAGRRLVSWRTYVQRHPGHAVLLALGLGMAVSAGLEIRASWSACKRLLVALVLAAGLGLAGLPVLVVAVAEWLAGQGGVPRWGWLVAFGSSLLAAAAAVAAVAWRGFRRRFVGLEQTIEELREDLRWIREWAGHED